MKNLIIIGAGGYGREAYTLAKNSIGYQEEFVVKGYLDSNLKAFEKSDGYPPILSTVEAYSIQPEDVFICAIGNIEIRKKTVNQILDKGGEFINLMHSSAYIGDNVILGKGVFIAYDVVISNDTSIEDFVLINSRALIGHDCHIGRWGTVGVYSFIGGGVRMGEESAVHARASIRNNVTLADHVTVGMGSVVIKDVKSSETVFGNPAKSVF